MRGAKILGAGVFVVALYGASGNVSGQAVADIDPRIEKLVASVSEERLKQLLEKLVSFGTRNTLSDTTSTTRGVGAARNWIRDELARTSPRLQVSFDTHILPAGGRIPRETELKNVIAVLPGKSPRRIYVSGHYDSLNLGSGGQASLNRGEGQTSGQGRGAQGQRPPADPNLDAPGANDDGSGTVLSMELARVFAESGIEFEATLVFMTVAGEEQGLRGSGAHAQKAKQDRIPIQALFNNDIVGNSTGGDGIVDGSSVRLYSEGPEDSPSRALAQFTRRVAARYVPSHRVRLMARRDRFSRGGDHSAFNASGFAAVGFRESRENYSKQHNANDTIDGVSFKYLLQNARVNAAAMATLALAPPAPTVTNERGAPMIDRRPSTYDARLRWAAAPGAVAYRIFWRDAWAPDWQNEMMVGNVTEYVLPHANIDDYVFGVAAIGPAGHESTISAYVMSPRADTFGPSD
jgi:Peptidase family M28